MSEYLTAPDGFVIMHDIDNNGDPVGTKFTVTPNTYKDLYDFLQPELDPTETGLIEIAGDMSRMIKVHGFEQYPASPEIPVSARRYETDWTVISSSGVSTFEIPHKLSAQLKDMIGYVMVSVTDHPTAIPGDTAFPMESAPRVMVYPYINNTNGFQFEALDNQSIQAFVADNGIEFYANGSLQSTSGIPSDTAIDATNFVVKFALYKIEHIYDFKDDRLVEKVDDYFHEHRWKLLSDDSVSVHGVSAAYEPTASTLARRDTGGRLKVGTAVHDQDAVNKGQLGTIAFQDANNAAITGGTATGMTKLAVTGSQTLDDGRARNIWVSATEPEGMADGDIWIESE